MEKQREKPRIRLIFRFTAFFEAQLLNRYKSVGIKDNIVGFKLRNGSNFYTGEYENWYIMNKTGGKLHSR